MPVVISAGHWQQRGWFLQRIGASWRWHVGGIDCDGGQAVPMGRWTHLAAMYDGSKAVLFQDGNPAAQKAGEPVRASWDGGLFVGHYSGDQSAPFQVHGLMGGVKYYVRPLTAEEAARSFQAGPPK